MTWRRGSINLVPSRALIQLGQFSLDEIIASGGMSQIWRGRHIRQGIHVAIKVVDRAADAPHADTIAQLFRNEARAMAGLTHPNIVTVYEHGVVPALAAARSDGALHEGSSYLVMELADQGAIQERQAPTWPRLRRILLALLDALSHAHARGVIHRDIKPPNVLVFDDDHIKLSDFGLAHHLNRDHHSDTKLVMGTPSYMAPEQLDARWHEHGPPTDLYAVGCLAFSLACGDPPFGRTGELAAIAAAHKHSPVPPLFPRSPMPPGLADWINQLLEKRPMSRFQCAADATTALLALAETVEDAVDDETSSGGFPPPETPQLHTLGFMNRRAVTRIAGVISSGAPMTPDEPAPPTIRETRFPATWRTPQMERLSLGSIVAGLGLYWLRSQPIVGRDEEQDALWQRLNRVVTASTTELVVLEGPAGLGKSQLARWLCERAHEAGIADVLGAVHNELAGPRHGLAPMVTRLLRCGGLSRQETLHHVRARLGREGWLDDGGCIAVTDLVHELDDAPANAAEPVVRFGSATERYVLLTRLLRAMSHSRPVIVWLDDVHWGPDALAFAHHFISSDAAVSTPVLLLLTARTDLLDSRPAERQLLSEVSAHPRSSRVTIGSLPEPVIADLVDRLLPLEEGLTHQVAKMSQGNPLYAVQLVGDWVDRDMLTPKDRGFGSGDITLLRHASLQAIWTRRVERVLRRYPDSAGIALEIAGVLGQQVDGAEWADACQVAEVAAPRELVDDLLERNLGLPAARGIEVGWSFCHSMLCEAIKQRAREMGRLRSHHDACAQMLRSRNSRDVGERIARHLIAAGNLREAVDPLLHAGARTRVETGDFVLADALLSEREQALQAMKCPRSDMRWGEGWLLRGRLTTRRGCYEEATIWAERCERAAAEHDWTAVHARALLLLGNIRRLKGETVAAERCLRRAEAESIDLDDDLLRAECHQELAKLLVDIGSLERAATHWQTSKRLFEAGGDVRGMVIATAAAAQLHAATEAWDQAMTLARAARDDFHQLGDRYGIAHCLQVMGDVARRRSDFDHASSYYERARKRYVTLGAAGAKATTELGLAITMLESGDTTAAKTALDTIARRLTELDRRHALALVSVALLSCSASAGAWDSWREHHDRGVELLAATQHVDIDLARLAELAGDGAAAAGEEIHARDAYAIAFTQWRTLGRDDGVTRVLGKLNETKA